MHPRTDAEKEKKMFILTAVPTVYWTHSRSSNRVSWKLMVYEKDPPDMLIIYCSYSLSVRRFTDKNQRNKHVDSDDGVTLKH